ncbi:YbjN domain-containing protein [Polynucleobacter sp. IMCC30063]|uniref:YbjN domain-containing protein n=1 Tax=Polynucleobacter sp. IMCC30063 TaxID=2907298 RepID=UPI001F35A3EE|nr:YbjN domain-containing protein [Polynucleobacter sp. IMCC30063]MCE7505653.1 YbjN domain-containing protein [Polynucleobacter sp. IMCC30063]
MATKKSPSKKMASKKAVKKSIKRVASKKPAAKKSAARSNAKATPSTAVKKVQIETFDQPLETLSQLQPITYALMRWAKSLGFQDSIEIDPDGNGAQWELTVESSNSKIEYQCFFNTFEESGLITMSIYYLDHEIPAKNLSKAKDLILQSNLNCFVGQFQLANEDKFLRYYSAVDLEDIEAIDPRLIGNMFHAGNQFMGGFIDQFIKIAIKAK